GGAGGEVGAQTDPVGVGDAYAGGHDVVDHPGELVDAVDSDGLAGRAQAAARQLEALDGARARGGPHDVGEEAEDAVHREPVRLHESRGEEVQTQPRVLRGGRGSGEVRDLDELDVGAHPAYVVGAGHGGQLGG